jgi:phage-related protein (TIGR01555 family)
MRGEERPLTPDEIRAVFEIPKPPPGVPAEAHSGMAMDDAYGGIAQWATMGLAGWGLSSLQAFRGYPYLAELAQRSEYRRGVEILAKEMTRKWIKLHSKSGDENKDDFLGKLNDRIEKFHVKSVFREAMEHDGFYGRGQIYIDTGDGQRPEELVTPLSLRRTKIRPGSLKRLRAIEPLWTYPGSYNSSNPLARDFYRPEWWYVQSTKVHTSRLIGIVSREVPDLLKPAYLFGGLSMTQMAMPYVERWLRAATSVSDLVNAFSIMVLSTDMSAALAGNDGDGLIRRIKLFNAYRNNGGTFAIDKDTEDFKNISAPTSGLDKLQAQAQEHMAAVFGIPIVKLFGITPSGLNASSDGEVRTFYDWVHSQQEHVFDDPLRRIIDIIQLSEFGAIDPDVSFSWEPLWETTEVERSMIRKTNADTAAVYVADGIIDAAEERKRLAAEEDGLYNGLDLSIQPEPPGGEGLDPNIGGGMGKEPQPGGGGGGAPPEPSGAGPGGGDAPEPNIAGDEQLGVDLTAAAPEWRLRCQFPEKPNRNQRGVQHGRSALARGSLPTTSPA